MKFKYIVLALLLSFQTLSSQWEKIDIPEGGTISQITTYNNSLYALALNSGIYKYQDEKWNKIDKSNDLLRLTTTFELDTINGFIYIASENNGLYKSNNNENWTKIHSGKNTKNNFIYVNKIKSYDELVMFISEKDIYFSSDYGTNWVNINSNLPKEITFYDILYYESKIYLATNNGLYISEDLGISWNSIVFDGAPVYGLYNVNNRIIATIINTFSNPIKFEVYEKDPFSDNFNIYANDIFRDLQILNIASYENRVSLLTLETDNFSYNYSLYYSENNGNSWDVIMNKESKNLRYFAFSMTMNKSNIFIGTLYDGVFTLDINGENNSLINNGLTANLLNSYYKDDTISITSSINSGIFYNSSQNQEWLRSESSPLLLDLQKNIIFYNNIRKLLKVKDKFIIATQKGLYQSADGIVWTDFALSDYNIIDIKMDNNELYALGELTSTYLYLSTDFGESWSSKNLPNQALAYSLMVDNEEVFVGSSVGLLKTVDNGNNWILINSNFVNSDIILSIAKQKNNSIIINNRNGIYISYDGGVSFAKVVSNFGNAQFNKIYTLDNVTIAATSLGTAFSFDYGATWDFQNTGLDSPNIMDINNLDTNIYAYQACGGIYKSNLVKISPIKIVSPIERIICKSSSFDISYIISPNLQFNIDNKFYVELSNENGIFDESSTIVGELNSTSNGIINVSLSENIINSDKYRFRIISTSPPVIGLDNQYNISITDKPRPEITGELNVCTGIDYSYSIPPVGSFDIKWTIFNGEIIGERNQEIVVVKWLEKGEGILKVELTGNSLCNGESSFLVEVIETPEKPKLTFDGTKLISNYDSGNQWYFEGIAIEGANQKEFTPTNDGNYSVRVNQTICFSEFSDSYFFKNVSDKLVFSIDTVYAYTGDDTWINIRLMKNQKYYELDINSISFDLVFNGSILYPKNESKGVIVNGFRYLNIEDDTNFVSGNILTSVPMKAMLGNADKTTFKLQNLKINNQNFDEFFVNEGMLYLVDVCYDGGPRLVTSEPFVQIEKISPNPITDNFELSIYSSQDQTIEIFLADIFGNKVESLYKGNLDKGISNLKLSINNYSIGEYFIMAETNLSTSIYKIVLSR